MSNPQAVEFDFFAGRMPEAVTALRTLSRISTQGVDKGLVELVKIRASQVNGCAYCVQLHLNWARKAGLSQGRLDRVAVWRDAPDFTQQERAALAWTEALTDPACHHEIGSARQGLEAVFTQEQVLRLTVAVATINAWNRIAGPLGFSPPPAQ